MKKKFTEKARVGLNLKMVSRKFNVSTRDFNFTVILPTKKQAALRLGAAVATGTGRKSILLQ